MLRVSKLFGMRIELTFSSLNVLTRNLNGWNKTLTQFSSLIFFLQGSIKTGRRHSAFGKLSENGKVGFYHQSVVTKIPTTFFLAMYLYVLQCIITQSPFWLFTTTHPYRTMIVSLWSVCTKLKLYHPDQSVPNHSCITPTNLYQTMTVSPQPICTKPWLYHPNQSVPNHDCITPTNLYQTMAASPWLICTQP